MDRILEQFTNSIFFKKVIDKYNPLAIFMTGSIAANVNNPKSDYDICVLVDIRGKPGKDFPGEPYQYIHKETGACIHYLTRGIDELFVNAKEGRIANAEDQYLWKALIEFGFGGEILYLRNDFKKCWDYLDANRRTISKAALYELYNKFNIGKSIVDIAFECGDLLPVRDIVYALLESNLISDRVISEHSMLRMKKLREMDPEGIKNLPVDEQMSYIHTIANVAEMFRHSQSIFENHKCLANAIYLKIIGELK